VTPAAHAVTQVWQGLVVDGNWSTPGNFAPGGLISPIDDLQFAGSNYLTTSNNNIGAPAP
jgi:hypothetical protein